MPGLRSHPRDSIHVAGTRGAGPSPDHSECPIMAIATLAFRRCVINSPEFGSDEEHVGSRIFFDLHVGGVGYANLFVDVREFVREGAKHKPLLITMPSGYTGPWNAPVFQSLVEFYYRHAVGVKWGMFGMRGPSMRLENWTVEQEMLVQFEVFDDNETGAGVR
ncbi:MAG: hypothetical protein D6704_08575 [Nitrospirae bacterium]|nr:MAG: hypothetical protein D6704_08575 [Nitrospirota bacterium]